ncbi:MAG: hypothetical protein K5858_07305 [Lachnospiraceae bacterium]|nr:hypothetical protein [Lachnospiraceae bacterium]
MEKNIMVWDTEKQAFNDIPSTEVINVLFPEESKDCLLFLSWLPHIKSVFLYKRKRMEIVFVDGITFEITNMPYLYDKLFSIRHGI